MKLSDHLSDYEKKKLVQLGSPKNKEKKKKDNLSHKDWIDIMGGNNRGLKRKKGGAFTNA
ncbi:hypothetical protein [Bacillus sp. 03113]|uniref:hypothetical protein n=1 Tax=Bacillus sp. 03113 TaxID=2578211 RepID=UPI001141866C|nr:hypothetical protein [Bacillus sp. 03113]